MPSDGKPGKSCDTFVVLPPLSRQGVVFGKNSDRPQGEVQEVIYVPAREDSGNVKCTYIEVEPCVGPTKAVILSKPNWMWGAEMGANECGVTVGNEAIWAVDDDGDADPSVKRLLGMDLLRLGLERSSSADEALDVITGLLEKYGQGGPCSNTDPGLNYHNSFLIADPNMAWVLETVGKHWVAQKITSGAKHISNVMTITTQIDRKSDGLLEYAKSKGFWNGEGDFNFAQTFSATSLLGDTRVESGKKLLKEISDGFRETDMFKILRDKEAEICRPCDAGFPTQGSQVSTLNSSTPNVHWFTATPDPSKSVYKPFVFTPGVVISKHTRCSEEMPEEPHTLYSLHKNATQSGDEQVQELLRNMEADCVQELEGLLQRLGENPSAENLAELDELFKDCVETEVKFYR